MKYDKVVAPLQAMSEKIVLVEKMGQIMYEVLTVGSSHKRWMVGEEGARRRRRKMAFHAHHHVLSHLLKED